MLCNINAANIDKWAIFLYNHPNGYWDELVEGIGEKLAEKIKSGGVVHQGCSATKVTYRINKLFIKYIFEWLMCTTGKSYEELKSNFINNIKVNRKMFSGYTFTEETIKKSKIKPGDVVLEGDYDYKFRVITSIPSKNCWEYFNENGYFSETKPAYCHWLVKGQKNAGGKLIKIV